jgi:hypothetical protein
VHLNAVCRRVHSVLTSSTASRRIEENSGLSIDVQGVNDVWEGLDKCWDQFEDIRRGSMAGGDVDPIVDRFVSAWQVRCTL